MARSGRIARSPGPSPSHAAISPGPSSVHSPSRLPQGSPGVVKTQRTFVRRLNLLSVSLAGENPLPLERPNALHPLGGHILLTSGTTGTIQNGADESGDRCRHPSAPCGTLRHRPAYLARCVRLWDLDRGRLQVGGLPLVGSGAMTRTQVEQAKARITSH